jgi:cell division protein FtsB
MIDRYRMVKEVDQLQRDRLFYSERIREDSARLSELRSDDNNLEKFAREQYLMKKDNEDIFIIVDD